MKTLKVKKMDVDDFIRDDKSAAVFLNEMIKLDSGDGSPCYRKYHQMSQCF